ncbi:MULTISPECIES: hypothetical protein [Bacillus]|uniref:hypothetical protein n=1 Tax=Bacillus TaxID=1386 RepID=UPI000BB856D0|nr:MULTISPECIES: hypothetical protein [Bacillus]
MTAILVVWPLILLVLVVIFTMFLVRGRDKAKNKYSSSRKRFTILYGYVGILIVALVVSPFIHSEEVKVDLAEREFESSEQFKISEEIYAGRISSVDEKLIQKRSEFSLPENKLILKHFHEYNPLEVVVERLEEDGNKVEMLVIKRRVIDNGVDFSDKFDPVNVTVDEGKIEITRMYEQELRIGVVQHGFPFYLFTDKNPYGMNHDYSYISDEIIYLRVPKNIEIIHDENHVYLYEIGK